MLFDATTYKAEAFRETLLDGGLSDEQINESEKQLKKHLNDLKIKIQMQNH